jgi:S1-C subfamily serine protease
VDEPKDEFIDRLLIAFFGAFRDVCALVGMIVIVFVLIGGLRSCIAADAVRIKYTYRHDVHGEVTGHGTAFPIAKRQLITAAHTVLDSKGNAHLTVVFEHQAHGVTIWLPAKVEWADKDTDLALLAIDLDLEPFALADQGPKVTQKLSLVGAPSGGEIVALIGLTSDVWVRGWAKHVAMTAGFGHGMSGGPVLADGQVVGMISAGKLKDDGKLDDKVCFFVPVEVIRSILRQRAAP